MPSLEEQNKGKISELDIAGVHLLWDKDNEPDFCAILDKYVVYPILNFKLDKDAVKYVQEELAKDKADKSKEAKKRLKWRHRVLTNQILNVNDIEPDFIKKNGKDADWIFMSTFIDFNEFPDYIEKFKYQIPYSILSQNESWIEDSKNPELDQVKSYWRLIINNHPQHEDPHFSVLTLGQIEEGVDPVAYYEANAK